jgi:hypothetical protein
MKTNAILSSAIVMALASAPVFAANDNKVTICHNGQEITISRAALSAHLAHGDNEGACPSAPATPSPVVAPTPGASPVTPVTPIIPDAVDSGGDTIADGSETPPVAEEPAPLCRAPVESEAVVELSDGSAYNITLLEQNGATWTYQIEHAAGKDLSHWSLGLGACLDHVTDASQGAELGRDGSTGFVGIKWDSEGGTFSFTLDAVYPATLLDALAKAGTMSASALIAGPDCAAEAVAEAPQEQESVPLEPVVINLEDDKDSAYSIALVGREGNTWTYEVAQVAGRDLSHWSLGLGACAEHLESASDGADVGTDGSTGFVGIKWDSEGGSFSLTLDGNYPQSTLEAIVKAGTQSAVGLVPGPDCSSGTVEELPPCTHPEALAAVPLGQELMLTSVMTEWDETLSALEPEQLLAQLDTIPFSRGFFFADALFLPNMEVPEVSVSFAGMRLHFNFSLLLTRAVEDGEVVFKVAATKLSPRKVHKHKVSGVYALEQMALAVPVLDVIDEHGVIKAHSLNLTLVSFDPMSFQAVLNEPLLPIVDEDGDEDNDDGDDD